MFLIWREWMRELHEGRQACLIPKLQRKQSQLLIKTAAVEFAHLLKISPGFYLRMKEWAILLCGNVCQGAGESSRKGCQERQDKGGSRWLAWAGFPVHQWRVRVTRECWEKSCVCITESSLRQLVFDCMALILYHSRWWLMGWDAKVWSSRLRKEKDIEIWSSATHNYRSHVFISSCCSKKCLCWKLKLKCSLHPTFAPERFLQLQRLSVSLQTIKLRLWAIFRLSGATFPSSLSKTSFFRSTLSADAGSVAKVDIAVILGENWEKYCLVQWGTSSAEDVGVGVVAARWGAVPDGWGEQV